MKLKLYTHMARSFLLLIGGAVLGLALPALGQLQWSSYNNTGGLVTANVASGGDATSGGSVTFTIPATTELVFMTKTFAPINLVAASSAAKVNFTLNASGGFTPTTRVIGMGLFNDPGTASTAADDYGFWTDLNDGNSPPSFELFYRTNGMTTFFQYDSTHKLGSGKVNTGFIVAASTAFLMQFQLNNIGGTTLGIGTSTSSTNTAGAFMIAGSDSCIAYSSAFATNNLPTTYNEFAFMFNNPSASAVTVTLSGITLVPANPVISTQPVGYSGSPGDTTPTTDFNVTLSANSATPLAYQWYQATASATNLLTDGATGNGSTISGSTTSNLVFTAAQVADNANYFVVITNAYGAVTSSPALLNIAGTPTAPVITGITPASATIIAGNGTNVVVSATGSPSPVYLWYDNNTNLLQSGASPTLTLTNVQLPGAGTYSVIASNSMGTATNNFTINVISVPAISSQPTNLLLNLGDPATFAVTATGVPAPGYQWYKGNSAIAGATSASCFIASVAFTDIGTYKVVITNSAGSVTSSNAILAINSTTLAATPAVPANGASGVCYDTPLTLSFNQPVTVGTTGKIYIYNVANNSTPVDTIDLSGSNPQSRTIGGDTFNTYPVIANGSAAVIYPHLDILTSNQTYYVTWQAGVFLDTNNAYIPAMTSPGTWQFATKVGGPTNSASLVVAADGSGDFATVQGAVDSVSSANASQVLINIRNGVYYEIVAIDSKNNLLLRGQSRSGVVIGYANNSGLNGSTHSRMACKVNANDIAFDNLTITNYTAQDLSQAEALMIESGAARIIVNNCNVDSYQDTILANISTSKAYFNNSLIQGDVDFIWGGGNLFFTNCEVRYLIRAGNAAALGPNPSPNVGYDISSNGFSFVSCRLTTLPGANPNDTIGRTRSITNGNTALINCFVSTNIGGWYSDAAPTSNYRNWYYGCTNDLGASVTLSNGIALAATDVNLTNASSATKWLYGWQPSLSPNILTNPVGQTVNYGSPATFSVVATGIPDPTYQWQHAGTNLLSGATSSTLTVASATLADGGDYAVIVTTSAGNVTSSTATLTVNPPPNIAPVFTAPPAGTNITINAGVSLALGCTATDSDTAAQTLTYSLLTGPSGAAVNAGSGSFTWRPTTAQANSVNAVSVVVTDNGTPNLSATNSFTVTVNPLTAPTTASAAYSGGQFSVSVGGQVGPDYYLQATTNLNGGTWTTVASTNSPASLPVILTDPNAGAQPMQFYRIVAGPPAP
jgi:pectin methylesterase-like acyl-CoA thioesterase